MNENAENNFEPNMSAAVSELYENRIKNEYPLNAAEAALNNNNNNNIQETLTIYPKPETPKKEKKIIKLLLKKSNERGLILGETYYIISTKWFNSWKEYVNLASSIDYHHLNRPGPIDNNDIIENPDEKEEKRIKKMATENYDYQIISKEIWENLFSWYGGGPPLPRKVISNSSGWNRNNLNIEVKFLTLQLMKSSNSTEVVKLYISRMSTLGEFKKIACQKLNLNPEDVRVWDYYNYNRFKLLENMDRTLEEYQILDEQPMLLEEKGQDGKFPEIQKNYPYNSSYNNDEQPTEPGTTGLRNLGNTCFMNSSIQCLSNTEPLTEYFLSDEYKNEINEDNPLGMKGELAEEYASLIKELWSGRYSAIAPREFKAKLERFAPQFIGYQQHDSQELLAFLLDGLHEDLNRVKKKPYIENPEVNNQPEEEVAKEAWKRHISRNNSIIVDWFQGQLKSTLVCPKCSRVSITFDPFMYLSLPLPMTETRKLLVHFVFNDPAKKPVRYFCKVLKHGTVKDLKNVLSKLTEVPEECITVTDIFSKKFFKIYNERDSLESIQDRDVTCAYEILPKKENVSYFYVYLGKEHSELRTHHLLDFPFILSIENPDKITYNQLYEKIYLKIKNFLKLPKDRIIETINELKLEESSEEMKDFENETDSDEKANEPQMKKKKRKIPLFTINITDSYVSNYKELENDNKSLNLTDHYLLVLFSSQLADDYYLNGSEEEEIFPMHSTFSLDHHKNDDDPITLDQCINLFTIEEKLGPDDPWYCNRCKEFQQATKKFDLWKLPDILVIHLKRFSYKTKYFVIREKIESFVAYPIYSLDLTSHVKGPIDNPPIYDLYAVSNHYGSLGGGHYIAYAKNKNNHNWYKFDDYHVEQVEESDIVTSSAYVLFYKRRNNSSIINHQNNNENQVQKKENIQKQENVQNHTRHYIPNQENNNSISIKNINKDIEMKDINSSDK